MDRRLWIQLHWPDHCPASLLHEEGGRRIRPSHPTSRSYRETGHSPTLQTARTRLSHSDVTAVGAGLAQPLPGGTDVHPPHLEKRVTKGQLSEHRSRDSPVQVRYPHTCTPSRYLLAPTCQDTTGLWQPRVAPDTFSRMYYTRVNFRRQRTRGPTPCGDLMAPTATRWQHPQIAGSALLAVH